MLFLEALGYCNTHHTAELNNDDRIVDGYTDILKGKTNKNNWLLILSGQVHYSRSDLMTIIE